MSLVPAAVRFTLSPTGGAETELRPPPCRGGCPAHLQRGERASWDYVQDEYNGFFSFVHAVLVGESVHLQPGESPTERGRRQGREALFLFPDEKIAWPVDLTRPGFDFPRTFFNGYDCLPRSTEAIPPYLRPRSSSLWVSDPYRLVRLRRTGNLEYAGIDYLQAYWMGRYQGFVGEEE